MALAGMTRIGREIAAQFAIGRIGIVHRLGRLQVGEASVVVVASAPHRRPAFEAALEAIDRLKREVPIWKKEYFADGAVWVDGEWDEALLSSASKQHD
jgi:molybdopterin synthase catalytic subunit